MVAVKNNYTSSSTYLVKVEALLVLRWIAASTNKAGFHVGQAYLPQPSLFTRISTAGWGGAISCVILCFSKRNALLQSYDLDTILQA